MKRSLLVAVLALALPVAACSSGTSGNSTPTTSDSASAAASSAAPSAAHSTPESATADSASSDTSEATAADKPYSFKESAPVDRPVRQGDVFTLTLGELRPTMNYFAAVCDADEPVEEADPTCLASTMVLIGNSPDREPINEDGTAKIEIVAEFDSPVLGRKDTLDCYSGACGFKVFVEKPEGDQLISLTRFTAEP